MVGGEGGGVPGIGGSGEGHRLTLMAPSWTHAANDWHIILGGTAPPPPPRGAGGGADGGGNRGHLLPCA